MNLRGKQIVERFARDAITDDTKGKVRQIVRAGGREQMRREFIETCGGLAQTKAVETPRGTVRTAQLDDGTAVSARGFSSGGKPSIRVNDPNSSGIVKVRYEK